MANPNPSRQTRFRTGISGNPSGCSAKTRELSGLKRMPPRQVHEITTRLLEGTYAALKTAKESSEASVLERWLATIINEGLEKPDAAILKTILDRLIGRPRDEPSEPQPHAASESQFDEIKDMSEEEIEEELERLRNNRLMLGTA